MSVSESSYSGSCSTGFMNKQNMQHTLLMAQMKLEEELYLQSSIEERKKLINLYLQSVKANPPIICDDFTSDLDWINVDSPPVSLNSYQNHIVVLDFFTYCCINCLHILPTLKRVESLYEHTNHFEVIGVHSAKFNNEKVLERVQDAVRRHNITHKVVSDPQATLWNKMNISCWPTVLILGPKNQLIFSLIGENNVFDYLQLYCETALQFFFPHLRVDNAAIAMKPETRRLFSLYYPTKLSISNDNGKLAIADCGHNRVVIVDFVNEIATSIGGPNAGHVDGCFQGSRFNNPQGISWVGTDRLYVVDSGNSCLRLCTFDDDTVITVCSSADDKRFLSPWDLTYVHGVLYIVCAGSHQLFALPVEDNCQVLGNPATRLQLQLLAGSGLEENRNNSYPLKASFAQPSGISYSAWNNSLLIADSESSTVRLVSLENGHVRNLVGGSKNPLDLFSFGDKDGVGLEARLQHPMGIAYNKNTKSALVVDTFNHKIKQVALDSRNCETLAGAGEAGNRFSCNFSCAQFNEPNGICYSTKDNVCYVADTNNHQIKLIDLNLRTVTALKLNFIKRVTTENINKVVKELPLILTSQGNTLTFRSNFVFSKDYAPSKNAPHHFRLNVPAEAYPYLEVERCDFPITNFHSQPAITVKLSEDAPEDIRFTLEGLVTVYYCSTTEDFCSFKEVTFKIPLLVEPGERSADHLQLELTFELI